MKTTFLAALPLLGSVAAAPNPVPELIERDSPVYRAENPATTPVLDQVTITLVNKMSKALSTSIASNDANTALVSGASTMGTMAPQATAVLVAPMSWSGNLALGEADYPMQGNDYITLLEFGLTLQGNITKMDVDASYVNGYSGALSCVCNDDSNTFLSGCTEDLWALNTCGADGEVDQQSEWGACQNPYRDMGSHTGDEASPFFQPCQHKAYTYYDDDAANSNGVCLTGDATCCVGTADDGCSV